MLSAQRMKSVAWYNMAYPSAAAAFFFNSSINNRKTPD
ncbi:hypothetical protein EPIR_2191 [Erwinia piriflorinigrans CFBP 5888]|uniref:Uncharacterized protein n=1 Tax=Erwinia piriflorinigrans CFBP 5888 TaxID=1161919 RepID=V5Z962_9GAMM|nr:hypothetical protein EPIR_2191 [Erwinia piriflorinigrans CFBP 5888]